MSSMGGASNRDTDTAANRQERKKKAGPKLDPLAMPPDELAKLKAEGYGHLIAKHRRMDDVPGYRRDW